MIKLHTNMGTITLELDEKNAPETVANFMQYVKDGHYANTIFHRVIDGFMIQGGGFDTNMSQKATKAPIKNEANNGLPNKTYTIAMARTPNPDSASSQFFINVADNDFLNFTSPTAQGWGYCVFGKIVAGTEVVDKIKKVKTGSRNGHQDVPVEPVIIERADQATSRHQFEVVGTKLLTQFSNNIRNNFGFLNRAAEEGVGARDKLFVQEGRKVFKEVCPMVAELIATHLEESKLNVADVKRFWLHQANLNMNLLIARKLLGRDAEPDEAPVILDTYANTSSAGSVIAFHKHQDDLPSGALGVLSSFGAGYSIGSVILRKR